MVRSSLHHTVAAPPERVFAVLTDLENLAGTVEAIESVELLTPGPVGPGTRFRETRVLFGREASEEMTVTRLEPPQRYELLAESHGCRYETIFTCRPDGDGGTELGLDFRATPLTFLAKVVTFLTRPLQKKMLAECAKDLADIGRVAEGVPES